MSISKMISAVRSDGWQNILTGLGMKNRDKRMSSTPIVNRFSQTELENLYRADDIAQKVIDRIPKEMFRAGYKIKVKDNVEAGDKIISYMKKLNADDSYRKAIKLARLHGGAAILLGIDDGQDAFMPVNYNAIRSIQWLTVLDRWSLIYDTIQRDFTKPNYGLPETYRIQAQNAEANEVNSVIHASRVIRFDGIEIPEQAFINNQYWGDSYLATIYNVLNNFNAAHDGAASTMQDFIQTVYELENLSDLIASGDDELVQKRLALIDATRSIIKAIVIQKGEVFRRDNINISGMHELLSKIEDRLVAACNMPHTIILGEGSQGQTSGESEKMDFYDQVAQEQVTVLMPKQMELIKLIALAKDGIQANLEEITIEYNPLWELSDSEKAQVYKSNAEADAIYISNGVLDPDEVTKSRFASGNGEIQIDNAVREAIAGDIITAENAVTSPEIALNGAQVSSLVEVITGVTSGTLPRESAQAIIKTAFALSDEVANDILANIGKGFVPTSTETPVIKTDSEYLPQKIFLSKSIYSSLDKAAAWITANNYSSADFLETEKTFEFKQCDQDEFVNGSLIVSELATGIKAIVGIKAAKPQAETELLVIENLIRNAL